MHKTVHLLDMISASSAELHNSEKLGSMSHTTCFFLVRGSFKQYHMKLQQLASVSSDQPCYPGPSWSSNSTVQTVLLNFAQHRELLAMDYGTSQLGD